MFSYFLKTKPHDKSYKKLLYVVAGGQEGNELYQAYHDKEWGIPVHDDRIHFEFLILEGAQAGLSWITILKRRQVYKKAFADFDPAVKEYLPVSEENTADGSI